jgi:type I restriction enzyme S subunit
VLRVPADAETVERFKLQPGDVLFNNTNSTELVGKSALFANHDEPVTFSNHFTRLRTIRGLLCPEYLALWLRDQWQNGLFAAICNRWIGQSAVQRDKLLSLELPLPLLPEQQRIARLVFEQLEAVERARAAAEVQVEAAKALPGVYLRTVFESATAQAWPTRTLAEMSEIVGGIQKSPDRVPVRLHRPYLTVRNVQRGCLDLSEVERFEVTPAEIERLRLLSGDILVVEGNGSIDQIGRNAIFVADGQEWIHQNHIIRVRLDGVAARPEFLSCFLNCDLGRAQMVKKAETTSGLYTLSAGKVASLEVPVPSLPVQDRLLSVLGEHMGQVERLLGQAGEKLAAINSLPAALMRRAFSGGALKGIAGPLLKVVSGIIV